MPSCSRGKASSASFLGDGLDSSGDRFPYSASPLVPTQVKPGFRGTRPGPGLDAEERGNSRALGVTLKHRLPAAARTPQ